MIEDILYPDLVGKALPTNYPTDKYERRQIHVGLRRQYGKTKTVKGVNNYQDAEDYFFWLRGIPKKQPRVYYSAENKDTNYGGWVRFQDMATFDGQWKGENFDVKTCFLQKHEHFPDPDFQESIIIGVTEAQYNLCQLYFAVYLKGPPERRTVKVYECRIDLGLHSLSKPARDPVLQAINEAKQAAIQNDLEKQNKIRAIVEEAMSAFALDEATTKAADFQKQLIVNQIVGESKDFDGSDDFWKDPPSDKIITESNSLFLKIHF